MRRAVAFAASVVVGLAAFAEPQNVGKSDVLWELDGTTIRLSGTGAMADFDYDRTRAPWFDHRKSITAVVVGAGVTSIGDNAFVYCTAVTNVTFAGSGVTRIGKSAFKGCSALTEAAIPPGVTNVGDSAFYDCDVLTNATIGSGVTRIADYTFSYCCKLERVTIPPGVTYVGKQAFYSCRSLKAVELPASVASVGEKAFYNCPALESATVGSGAIGASAFGECLAMETLTLGAGVTSIGDSAFIWCSNLVSVTIPAKVTSIGDSAFFACRRIKSVTVPASVTYIGGRAFYDCGALTSLVMESETPPYLDSTYPLFDIYKRPPEIFVPVGCVEAYKTANVWSGYKDAIRTWPEGCERNPWRAGEGVTAATNGAGRMTIEGAGKVTAAPWANCSAEITELQVAAGVTDLGVAMAALPNLTSVNGLSIEAFDSVAAAGAAVVGAEFVMTEGGVARIGVSVYVKTDLADATEDWTKTRFFAQPRIDSDDDKQVLLPVPANGKRGFYLLRSK